MSCLRSRRPRRQVILKISFKKTENKVRNRVAEEQSGGKCTGLPGTGGLMISQNRSEIQYLANSSL